jgi:Zn-dependent oligopeptidase
MFADAVTFFHEFGHAVHGLLSRTQFSKFHGTRFVYGGAVGAVFHLEPLC